MISRNKPSLVSELLRNDIHNSLQVLEKTGEIVRLPDDVAQLYDEFLEELRPQLGSARERFTSALFIAAKAHLIFGAASLFRLHSLQMFRETRAALEAGGIAQAIASSDESYTVFKNDLTGDSAARNAAKKHFTTRVLFPTNLGLMQPLGMFYKLASDYSHTNARSFLLKHKLDTVSDRFVFNYQDITGAELPVLMPKLISWLCLAHISILDSTAFTFSTAVLPDFEKELAYLRAKVQRFFTANLKDGELIFKL